MHCASLKQVHHDCYKGQLHALAYFTLSLLTQICPALLGNTQKHTFFWNDRKFAKLYQSHEGSPRMQSSMRPKVLQALHVNTVTSSCHCLGFFLVSLLRKDHSGPLIAPLIVSIMPTLLHNVRLSRQVWVAGVSSLEGGSTGGARVL